MIFYFSGTGNSKWVAEELARRTGDELQAIAPLLRDGPTAVYVNKESRVGIVFPVYAWGAPEIVERFCRSLTVEDGAYVYAVCTCGDEAGKAMHRLKRFLAYQSAWSIAMPNNYIIGYDVDSPELENRKISTAREKLASISESVLANARVSDIYEGPAAGLKTALVRPLFNTFAMRTKPFYATDACTACGLCERICPVGAVRVESGKPNWVRAHCTQCLGCINRCPERAIQYGAGTEKRGRYYFRDHA